jgi:hypothetical protein
MMEFLYPILSELLRVLMIGAISVEYLGEGIGPSPLTLTILLSWVTFAEMVSELLFPLLGWSGCG